MVRTKLSRKVRSRKVRKSRSVGRSVGRKQKGGADMFIKYPTFTVDNNTVTKEAASSVPKINLDPVNLSTIVMYDPDAAIPQWLHYLVINIPNGDISMGYVVRPYSGPTPPAGSGTHRYIFEQLEQTDPLFMTIDNPAGFKIDKFRLKYGLNMKSTKMFRVDTSSAAPAPITK